MAPNRPPMILVKERFSSAFRNFKTTSYHDPGARGAGPHVSGSLLQPRITYVTVHVNEKPTTNVNSRIRCIDWNPLGTLVATGAADKTLRVWNPERSNVRYSTELKGHEGSIEKVAFNPVKDAELCSVSADGVAKFWDVRTKTLLNEVKGLGDAFTLVWHPDGESLIVGNKADALFVLDPTQVTPIATYQQEVQTNQLAFCWSGTKLFLTTGEGRVKVLNYPDFTPVYGIRLGEEKPFSLNGHTNSALSVALQPTARHLATGGSDSIIALWDTKTWICQRTLIDMVGPVRNISFSFDGSYIVGGSDEGTGLEIAHVESGDYVHSMKAPNPCPVVAWHPSKYHLAYADITGLKIVGVDADGRR